MDAVRENIIDIFSAFSGGTLSLEKSMEFQYNMMDIYRDNFFDEQKELIRDSTKACRRIVYLMTLADSPFRRRALLYWILYILNKGIISVENTEVFFQGSLCEIMDICIVTII